MTETERRELREGFIAGALYWRNESRKKAYQGDSSRHLRLIWKTRSQTLFEAAMTVKGFK